MEEDGLVRVRSRHGMAETVARLESIVAGKGIAMLARIDHSGDAEKAGLTMPPTMLLIFGNARAGTPLMVASPGIAIDLPLKALVSEDAEGAVWVTYNSPEYLRVRHGLPEELVKNIAGIDRICAEAAA